MSLILSAKCAFVPLFQKADTFTGLKEMRAMQDSPKENVMVQYKD